MSHVRSSVKRFDVAVGRNCLRSTAAELRANRFSDTDRAIFSVTPAELVTLRTETMKTRHDLQFVCFSEKYK